VRRFTNEDIERLKKEISIRDLVEGSGIKLVRHGASWIGRCAFHTPDKTPSMVVTSTSKKNLFHCMSCGAAGSPIDWVMKSEGLSFVKAVAKLMSMKGELKKSRMTAKKASDEEERAPPAARTPADEALLQEVVEFYHEALLESPSAIAYLEERGIGSPEVIERFKIGYGNRTLERALPSKSTKIGAEKRGRLSSLGVLRRGGHGEHFVGSIVIPIFDERGCVAQLYGRRVVDPRSKGVPRHRYLPGPHRAPFHLEAYKGSEEVILCEALIDALTLYAAGIVNVTSSFGVEGFTAHHLEAMKKYGTKRVLVAYDRDAGGDRAALAIGKKLLREGIHCYRVELELETDINEYALRYPPAEKSLRTVLARATPMLGAPPRETDAMEIVSVESTPSAPSSPREAKVLDPVSVVIEREVKAFASAISAPPSFVNEVMVLEAAASFAAQGETSPTESTLEEVTNASSRAPAEPVPFLAADPERSSVPPAPALSAAHEREPASLAPASLDAQATKTSPPAKESELAAGGDAEVKEEEIVFRFGERRYRVRGLFKNSSVEVMKVNILAAKCERFFVDNLDLYAARFRASFIKQAAEELGMNEDLVKADVGKVLLKLEALQEEHMKKLLTPKDSAVALTPEQEAAALELLKDPQLLERILEDFERCGVVGERINKLTAYIAAVSRKLDDPLAIIIQSSSAAGKSSLMDAVLAFMPAEDRVKYSAMTGQALFYMGETSLKHKILAIVEEEGAERASYALKLLQSEKEISIASTGKDETGRLITREYRVEGPAMIFLSTTAVSMDDELLNRAIVLTVDEDREQTQAIHRLQRRRETLEGVFEQHEKESILGLHQNAQRLLRPLRVANPFAERLTFIDTKTRTRRDHMKYLVLIRASALLHQYQRMMRTARRGCDVIDYIEATLDDVELANLIAHHVLGRSLDHFAPQTRRFLEAVDRMVTALEKEQSKERREVRFTRREIVERAGCTYDQIRLHLPPLVEREYVLVHGGRRGQSYSYELVFDGNKDGGRFLVGLIDIDELRESLGTPRRGLGGTHPVFGVPLGAQWAGIGASLGWAKNRKTASDSAVLTVENGASPKNAPGETKSNGHEKGGVAPIEGPRPSLS
jgi:DNA primase catalytic core